MAMIKNHRVIMKVIISFFNLIDHLITRRKTQWMINPKQSMT